LPLVGAWGDGYEASSDLVSLDTSRNLWSARVDPKRRRFAVETYAHVLNSNRLRAQGVDELESAGISAQENYPRSGVGTTKRGSVDRSAR
jgi:hypothetical protein